MGLKRADIIRCLTPLQEQGELELTGLPTGGDYSLNTGQPLREYVPAAVLVLLVEYPDHYSVLLTRRTEHLKHHPGEISLPGGRIEEHDGDAATAALRETEEEVGIEAQEITLLGRVENYPTRTGFEVVPVVGVVRPPLQLSPDSFEVAEVFEVPLDHFLDVGNHQRHCLDYQGERLFYHAIPYGDYYIWGATAGILKSLTTRLLQGG